MCLIPVSQLTFRVGCWYCEVFPSTYGDTCHSNIVSVCGIQKMTNQLATQALKSPLLLLLLFMLTHVKHLTIIVQQYVVRKFYFPYSQGLVQLENVGEF